METSKYGITPIWKFFAEEIEFVQAKYKQMGRKPAY